MATLQDGWIISKDRAWCDSVLKFFHSLRQVSSPLPSTCTVELQLTALDGNVMRSVVSVHPLVCFHSISWSLRVHSSPEIQGHRSSWSTSKVNAKKCLYAWRKSVSQSVYMANLLILHCSFHVWRPKMAFKATRNMPFTLVLQKLSSFSASSKIFNIVLVMVSYILFTGYSIMLFMNPLNFIGLFHCCYFESASC